MEGVLDGVSVVFVNPNWNYGGQGIFNRVWPPLSLAVSASMLRRDGVESRILDATALGLSPGEAVGMLGEGVEKIFVTSSSLDKWQCPHLNLDFVREFIVRVRQRVPRAEIFLTGAHGTVRPQWVFDELAPDYVIRGEPEAAVCEIAGGADPRDVESVSYPGGRGLVDNPLSEPLDMAGFPSPAFDLLPMKKYYYEVMGGNFALLEGSRGCPFSCGFCFQKMYRGFRTKPIQLLLSEIDEAVRVHGVKNIYFIDLEFTVSREMVEAVCRHIVESGYDFGWCCQTRADSVDEGLLALMRQAGCRLIHFGVESGSERILKMAGKGLGRDDVRRGFRLARDAGIETAGFFMFGFPGETSEQMDETIDFALELNPTYASFHHFIAYPGLSLCEGADVGGGFPVCLAEHGLPKLRGVVKKAFFRFYLRPGYVLSRIRRGNPGSWLRQIRLFTRYVTKATP